MRDVFSSHPSAATVRDLTTTAFAGHVKMREDYVAHPVDLVKSHRTRGLLMTSHPVGLSAPGVLLLALSLYLEARGRRPGDPSPAETTEPAPVTA